MLLLFVIVYLFLFNNTLFIKFKWCYNNNLTYCLAYICQLLNGKMGINIDSIINELYLDEKLINLFNTYDKYINFRFDYAIRTNLTHIPEEFNYNIDCEY